MYVPTDEAKKNPRRLRINYRNKEFWIGIGGEIVIDTKNGIVKIPEATEKQYKYCFENNICKNLIIFKESSKE